VAGKGEGSIILFIFLLNISRMQDLRFSRREDDEDDLDFGVA
jgi:hypothetical protein